MLYVVATPIGNLGDISFRAIETLNNVDLILVEDTRHFRILAAKYDIKTPVKSYHAHSSPATLRGYLDMLKAGQKLALVSDAGTPLISDPGYSLVHQSRAEGLQVVPIPGATSIITALMASGLPADKFVYLGFFPAKKGRQTLCKQMVSSKLTHVFLESVHRVAKTLDLLSQQLPEDKIICVARELTKIHEEFSYFKAGQVDDFLKSLTLKGEFVILVAPDGFKLD